MRNPLNRFQAWSIVALPPAGEWYVGGFAGGAFPEETDADVPISGTSVVRPGLEFQEIHYH